MHRLQSNLWLLVALVFVVTIYGAVYLAARPATQTSERAFAPSGVLPSVGGAVPVSTTSTQPKISWSVAQATASGFPGTTSTLTVSFESDQPLNSGVVISLSPSLTGKVTAMPSSFESIAANQSYQVIFTFTVPSGFTKRKYSGTLHLVANDGSNQTYAPPLPVSLQADWSTQTPDGLFTIDLPFEFTLTDVSTQNTYSTKVFEVQLNDGDKVGYIWVYTAQQWAAAQEAEEYPRLLIEAKGLVYAFGLSQALPLSEQRVRTEFLTAIGSIRPL